eukprot:6178134-Pleurochrysis_carterae.AAC.1
MVDDARPGTHPSGGGKKRRKKQPKAARKAQTDEPDKVELEQQDEQSTDQGGALRKALGDSDWMLARNGTELGHPSQPKTSNACVHTTTLSPFARRD